jgi:hypothetical protein
VTTYPIEHETLDDRDIHVVKLAGELSVTGLLAFIEQLDALAAQQPSIELLLDESDAKASLISPLDLRRIARAWGDSTAAERTRIAIFAPSPVIYGLNRMVQVFGNTERRMKVFKSRAEATAWLGEE